MKKRPQNEPKMPKHLDRIGGAEWNRLVQALTAQGTLSDGDGAMLEAAAGAYAEYRAALGAMSKAGGAAYRTESGRVYAHPLATVAGDAWRRWHAGLQSLGLSPTSRRRAVAGREPKAEEPKRVTPQGRDPRDVLRGDL